MKGAQNLDDFGHSTYLWGVRTEPGAKVANVGQEQEQEVME